MMRSFYLPEGRPDTPERRRLERKQTISAVLGWATWFTILFFIVLQLLSH